MRFWDKCFQSPFKLWNPVNTHGQGSFLYQSSLAETQSTSALTAQGYPSATPDTVVWSFGAIPKSQYTWHECLPQQWVFQMQLGVPMLNGLLSPWLQPTILFIAAAPSKRAAPCALFCISRLSLFLTYLALGQLISHTYTPIIFSSPAHLPFSL